MNLSHEHFSFGRSLTIGTLLALAAGVVAGTLAPPTDHGLLPVLSQVVETLGAAWVRALRMTVMPVVVALLVEVMARAVNRQYAANSSAVTRPGPLT